MSDHASHDTHAPENTTGPFTPIEIEQFGADDVTAGGAIGKMLSALFLYTVLAMGLAGWWTYSSIKADKATAAEKESGENHEHSSTHKAH